MRKRSIGSLDVSVVGVGSNNIGRELDLEASRCVVHAALDAGVNLFDTADNYGRPTTSGESVLGEILKSRRKHVILATKFGRALGGDGGGAGARYVRAATEASLRRLQTDYIDLMQLHVPDPDTPIEETLTVLDQLKREGKIREIGASNFTADQLRKMSQLARMHDVPGFASTQISYSLLRRKPAADLLAECKRSGIRLLPYHPLFNGLLTGKYNTGAPAPAASRIGGKSPAARAKFMSPSNLATVAALAIYARERGHTILELAFGWLLAHDCIPSIIAGVSSPEQIVSNAASVGWELTGREIEEIDQLLETHAPSGDQMIFNGV